MRYEPENGIITLMRGDSFSMPIRINDGTRLEPHFRKLSARDTVYFGLMKPGQAFEDAVVKKVYDNSSPTDAEANVLLRLNPEDTINLLTGKYYYMIKLRTFDELDNEWVRTIVQPTLFYLEGNNPEPAETPYWRQGDYNIDNIISDGGEESVDNIILDGGELTL